MSVRPAIVLLATLIKAGGMAAQTTAPPPAAHAQPDPLRLAAAPPSLAQLGFNLQPGWWLGVQLGYFNLWNGTWHTGTIHKEFGLLGTPLQAWELRTLEHRHSADAIHRYDVEGWVGAATVARGFANGVVVALEVPWMEVGAPHWDALAWRFHGAVGLDQARRDWFPRGQTVVYAYYGGSVIEGWQELNGTALADVTLSASGPLGVFLGGAQRWGVALQAPTGERGTLAGSGGWDGGVRWGVQWHGSRHRMTAAAGYTWLDRGGSFLGARRSHTAHAQVAVAYRPGERTWIDLAARADTSPLRQFSPSAVGRGAVALTLGVARPLGPGGWVTFAVGENLPMLGAAPDFTLNLALSLTLPDGQ
jgi:hypothetical protein